MSETRIRDRGTEDGQCRIGTVVGPRASRARGAETGWYQTQRVLVSKVRLASMKFRCITG